MQKSSGDMLRFYKKVFDDFPALIWRAGLDMGCDYFNSTWMEFTGRSLEEERGNGWTEGVHPDDLAACMAKYVESFEQRLPFEMHYRLRHRSGEYRWIRDIGRPFHDEDGNFVGYIGSCYDETKERAYEERLLEMNRSKDQFFSLMAHDLVGPIAAIESITGILERDHKSFDEPTLDEMMHELGKATVGVASFLQELLDWAFSQFQGMTCRSQVLGLRETCEAAVEPLRQNLRVKDLDLVDDIDAALAVNADPDMTKAIIRNLVANAIKFCRPRGTIRLSATLKGEMAQLSVSDQGVGIPAEELAFLFDLEHRRKRKGAGGEKGVGLGLVLCRDFAELCGGRIWAESRLGEGSVFTVELPSAPASG